MRQEIVIYDIGPKNGSAVDSPFYNMELGRTMDYDNLRHVYVIVFRKYLRLVVY